MFWLGIPVGWMLHKWLSQKNVVVGAWGSSPAGAAWDRDTTYNMGDVVWIEMGGTSELTPVYYKSLIDNNKDNLPQPYSQYWAPN